MSKKKKQMYHTSWVEANQSTIDKLFGLDKKEDETQENDEELEEKEKTKKELKDDVKYLLNFLRLTISSIVFIINLACSIVSAIESRPLSKLAIVFVVLSILSLFNLWSVVKIKEEKKFKKAFKIKLLTTLLLSFGAFSCKWFSYMFIMLVFNYFAILGYAFFFNNFKVKSNAKKPATTKSPTINSTLRFF